MPDFELGDDMVFGGEDAELERAMHRDLARVGAQDGGVGLDTPSKRPRSPYVKWSKEEDDLLAQVSPCLHIQTKIWYLKKKSLSTSRQLRNTVKNGTWCRKRCRREGIIKYVNDGFASSAYLIVSPTYPRFRLGASASRQGQISLLMVVHHPGLLLGLVVVVRVEVAIRCYYLNRNWG